MPNDLNTVKKARVRKGAAAAKKESKPYHHGALREELIRAAVEIIEAAGPDAFSLRAAARRAGVSAAAPAHHFGDVRGLLTAVATIGFRDFADDPAELAQLERLPEAVFASLNVPKKAGSPAKQKHRPIGGVTMSNDRVFAMKFSKVYPLYVQKAERKNRTQAEVDQVIRWLTGYSQAQLQRQIERETDLKTFFAEAPALHPNSALIKGVVCGIRVEEIADPLMQKIRYLDKLIDELAKGKAMEKILRS